MNTGLLWSQVIVLRRVATPHEYGGDTLLWAEVVRFRALPRSRGGAVSVSDNEEFASVSILFECNEYVRQIVRPYDRLRYQGDIYQVEYIESHRISRKTIIHATRVNE